MNYLLKSKPKSSGKGKLIAVVSVFLLLSALALFFPQITRRASYGLAKPFWIAGDVIAKPFLKAKAFFSFKNNLIEENLGLKDEVQTLKLREIDYDILLRENENLKAQLGRSDSLNQVIARVLSKPPRSPYDTLVIDLGSEDGAALGSRVYLSDNVMIGVITNVTPKTSLVQLFSSGEVKQEVVLSRTGASFILTGAGGANLSLEVPKDTDILWGDVFMYPGLNSSVIGSVYYIDSDSQSSFKKAYIRIPGNVFETKWVFVEKDL